MDEMTARSTAPPLSWELPTESNLPEHCAQRQEATQPEQTVRAQTRRHSWPSVFGYVLAAAGLLWVLHGFQLSQMRTLLGHLAWRWLALAVLFDVLSYVCQGVRWRLLLKPLGRISTLRATQAIYAGLFTNELLPLRLGELIRTYLVARWTASQFFAVLSSLMIERLFDAFWLAAGVGLTTLFVPLPNDLLWAAKALGLAVVSASVLLCYFVLRPRNTATKPPGWLRWLQAPLQNLWQGLQGMGRQPAFYQALGASLLLLVFQALAFWLVLLGCGLQLSVWVGVAVFLIVHLGTAIPNAPANVGAYQFFTVIGLTLFGVDRTAATSISLVVFVLLTLPLLILGFVAISTSGASLPKLQREVRLLAT